MSLELSSNGEQEQQLLQNCNAAGLGQWVYAIQAILDRLRGLEEYIDEAADCPLPAVTDAVVGAAVCEPRARDRWLVSRLVRLRCFFFFVFFFCFCWVLLRVFFCFFVFWGVVL